MKKRLRYQVQLDNRWCYRCAQTREFKKDAGGRAFACVFCKTVQQDAESVKDRRPDGELATDGT